MHLDKGPYATDAQHVSVEFVHPVIVGKRALPALDLSILFRPWLEAIVRPDDIVMGFGPPEGDPSVWVALDAADSRGAMTFALPGLEGSYTIPPSSADPFIQQELVEVLYHTLWETVHVFFEHRELGHDVGEAEFLYPFLGREKQLTSDTTRAGGRFDSYEGGTMTRGCERKWPRKKRSRSAMPLPQLPNAFVAAES